MFGRIWKGRLVLLTYPTTLSKSERYVNFKEVTISPKTKLEYLSNRDFWLTGLLNLEIKYWLQPALNATEFKHIQRVEDTGSFIQLYKNVFDFGPFCEKVTQKIFHNSQHRII